MKTVKVNLGKRSYKIVIGNDNLTTLASVLKKLSLGDTAYIITNNQIKAKYGSALAQVLKDSGFDIRFKLVADTEKAKSIAEAAMLFKDIAGFDRKKKLFIVALGGGVVGDLAGFVAAVYKRGIPYIQVPTTLLAQVDSSIGGKTALDLKEAKNLIGAFYQPRLVFSNTDFLKSLDLRQVSSGLAEVVKYGLISDTRLFSYLEKNAAQILAKKSIALEFIIWRSSLIKARVVQNDEREEKGLRTVLNFGHTVGHAIEAAGGYRGYSHGEAVALGMLVACEISLKLGLLKEGALVRIERLFKALGLPQKIKQVSLPKLIKAHYHDKKFVGAKNRFVLLRDIGRAVVVKNVPLEVVKEAVKSRLL